MDTMIPNKLQFNLELHDLPVRATQLAPEALELSSGCSPFWIPRGKSRDCGRACEKYSREKWNIYVSNNPTSVFKNCMCYAQNADISSGGCGE